MLLRKFKSCSKHPEKIEAMASWLIFGGLLPLAITWGTFMIMQINFFEDRSLTEILGPSLYPYLFVSLMGAASLCVKRGGSPWRVIVGCGMVAIIGAAIIPLFQPETCCALWPIALLFFVIRQYTHDIRASTEHQEVIVVA